MLSLTLNTKKTTLILNANNTVSTVRLFSGVAAEAADAKNDTLIHQKSNGTVRVICLGLFLLFAAGEFELFSSEPGFELLSGGLFSSSRVIQLTQRPFRAKWALIRDRYDTLVRRLPCLFALVHSAVLALPYIYFVVYTLLNLYATFRGWGQLPKHFLVESPSTISLPSPVALSDSTLSNQSLVASVNFVPKVHEVSHVNAHSSSAVLEHRVLYNRNLDRLSDQKYVSLTEALRADLLRDIDDEGSDFGQNLRKVCVRSDCMPQSKAPSTISGSQPLLVAPEITAPTSAQPLLMAPEAPASTAAPSSEQREPFPHFGRTLDVFVADARGLPVRDSNGVSAAYGLSFAGWQGDVPVINFGEDLCTVHPGRVHDAHMLVKINWGVYSLRRFY